MRRILTLLAVLSFCAVAAQERFGQVLRRNPWNGGVVAAGLRQDTVSRSFAEVYFVKENGGLTDRSSSDDSWNAGARTASVRHFEKVSFAGGFSYDYFDGRNMCGSIFTVPGLYPVDILEFTPGRKVRETYAFDGALSAVLGERWTGGLKVAFEASNYAKRKDLRHKNMRLDFEFAPGIVYHAGRFAAGAAYIVGVDREKIEAEEIGASADSYMAFFDRGLRYGSLQLWQSNDLHLSTAGVTGFPIKQTTQGAALAVQFGPWFAEAAYRYRSGRTGERIAWHEFRTHELRADVGWRLARTDVCHDVRLGLVREWLDNRENIITYQTVNGVSNPQLHGSVPIFGRRRLDAEVSYERTTQRSDLRVGASGSFLGRRSTLMYPYVREQRLHHASLWADWVQKFGRWELNLAADFRTGGFSERDERLETSAEPGDYPVRLTDYYDYENEYLTADRLGVGAGVRRRIRSFYIDLSARYERGFGLRIVERPDRVRAMLCVGYDF
ncbi:MAG: hypothetical protein K2N04_00440 [Alistipes sp.]|nr:hypothetical protein [Alistipes sp.]